MILKVGGCNYTGVPHNRKTLVNTRKLIVHTKNIRHRALGHQWSVAKALAGQWLWVWAWMVCGCPSCGCLFSKGPRGYVSRGLRVFFSYFCWCCFSDAFLKASGSFLSHDERFGCQNDLKNQSKIYKKSIKKGMLKMIPDTEQKSLKSDAPDFGKSSKTIVLSSIFVVSTHVH
jgi:hypothetical protein